MKLSAQEAFKKLGFSDNNPEKNEELLEAMIELGWMKKIGQADGDSYYEMTQLAIDCARDPDIMGRVVEKVKESRLR